MLRYQKIAKTMSRIVNPILFDVSLRDGIQGADPTQYSTATKKNDIYRYSNQVFPAENGNRVVCVAQSAAHHGRHARINRFLCQEVARGRQPARFVCVGSE